MYMHYAIGTCMSQNILCKHGQEQENKAFTGEELEVEVGRSKYVPLFA